MNWQLAHRTTRMNASAIREILKLTERPGVISLAGGLPSPHSFPVAEFAAACEQVLRDDGPAALQYGPSEGHGPLREWVAASLPWPVSPSQVLITTGSQQGLDLLAKVLIDAGSRVLVETPTYLGALQAFAPMEPQIDSVAGDEQGLLPEALASACAAGHAPRFLYVLPNFQNPTGRTLGEARRTALVNSAERLGLPLVEDNPYGELWFDAPPPAPLAARHPEGCVYLGSFSKVLAPGLRLGFVVAPPVLMGRLLQAKQAADLHTPSFTQRLAAQVLQGDFLTRHLPAVRERYRDQRDAMLAALTRHMAPFTGPGDQAMRWNRPAGGMFLWLRLPAGLDATALLPRAVARGVAFVPGAAFYPGPADVRTMRLSFVTAAPAEIEAGIAALAAAVAEMRPWSGATA